MSLYLIIHKSLTRPKPIMEVLCVFLKPDILLALSKKSFTVVQKLLHQ